MDSDSPAESEKLADDASNFASWYRFISRQDISRQLDLFHELRHALDGFDSMKLDGAADSTVTMRVIFKNASGKPTSLKFKQLSDGQRQLIVLHTLLYGLSNEHRTLFLDEPDNYVALREIQPWLTSLIDAAGRSIDQSIIISHHPEVIDQLAPENGVWLYRDGNGPTRAETGRATMSAPLRPSEVEARGW
jgi:predicted ATPase